MSGPIPDWAAQVARDLYPPSSGNPVIPDVDRPVIAQAIADAHSRATTSKATLLRAALVGLVGVDGPTELGKMETMLRLLPAPAEDKAAMVNAVYALLQTVEG